MGALEDAARELGIDVEQLRTLKRQQDRDEVKSIFREVLEEAGLLGGDDGGDGDDDLTTAARKKAAGKKVEPPAKDEPDDEPTPEPVSLAARLGLTGS